MKVNATHTVSSITEKRLLNRLVVKLPTGAYGMQEMEVDYQIIRKLILHYICAVGG